MCEDSYSIMEIMGKLQLNITKNEELTRFPKVPQISLPPIALS